jgi:hypothetical protein
MSKIFYHKITRHPIVVDDDAVITDFPDYQTVEPPITDAELEEMKRNFRKLRNEELARTDKYVLPDRPVNQEILDYRQQLRDATDHPNWPFEYPDIPLKLGPNSD